MALLDIAGLQALIENYPKADVHYVYGTAGFRMEASLLPSVISRVGALAALRSKAHGGKFVGVMITASHNPAKDNGVKLVEPMGEMLHQSWETYASDLANCRRSDDVISTIQRIIESENIDLSAPANVVVGRDTRPSGSVLVEAFTSGVVALKGGLNDFGLLTTPELHYMTRCLNTVQSASPYGIPTEEGYLAKLASSFQRKGFRPSSALKVDCANGVGAIAMSKLAAMLDDHIRFELYNTATSDESSLNFNCGADYVKINQGFPTGLHIRSGERGCSLDGDADRLVYYYMAQDGAFKLLDGDKIATLAASFIIKLVRKADLALRVGLVQTAYANGSSTNYIKEKLGIPVVFTSTGVKYLHHAAEEFDIGVYFEANGHGTILFSDTAVRAFQSEGASGTHKEALETLQSLADLINQTVGDALSDLLLVEAILAIEQKGLPGWDAEYNDLPSRQEKVKVLKREMFVTAEADTVITSPPGLQERINQEVIRVPRGRCFVRPSGTEDIVRVYAEASTQDEANNLAYRVCGIVFDEYGGVGSRPLNFI